MLGVNHFAGGGWIGNFPVNPNPGILSQRYCDMSGRSARGRHGAMQLRDVVSVFLALRNADKQGVYKLLLESCRFWAYETRTD